MNTHTFEELSAEKAWTVGRQGRRAGTPQVIDEQTAIEIALRYLCRANGSSKVVKDGLLRPDYGKRPNFVRAVTTESSPDQMGWTFWFEFPGPMPSGFSLALFVGDPSGVIATGDMI